MLSDKEFKSICDENKRVGKKTFEVTVEPLKRHEKQMYSLEGDFHLSLTRNGRQWQTFRLWKEEIDIVIKALQVAKERGEENEI